VLYRDKEWNLMGEEEYIDQEKLEGKFDEISFVEPSDFSNDSTTVKFIRELESKNESIQSKRLSEKQLSHLMMHKIQFVVNGIWMEHDVRKLLFPIVSITNSTKNESNLEVLYLDCSLADINLQFLDLFDFTTNFVFCCYILEGICFLGLLVAFIKSQISSSMDIIIINNIPYYFLDVPELIFWITLGLSHITLIFYQLSFSTYFVVCLHLAINMAWISMFLCL
jgi:hypothetical protein